VAVRTCGTTYASIATRGTGGQLMRRSRHSRRSAQYALAEEQRSWRRQVREAGPLTPPPAPPRSRRRRVAVRLLVVGVVALGVGGGMLRGDLALGASLGVAVGVVLDAALIAGDGTS
jgi:hypothetical protein